jgi:hypothetical protein
MRIDLFHIPRIPEREHLDSVTRPRLIVGIAPGLIGYHDKNTLHER